MLYIKSDQNRTTQTKVLIQLQSQMCGGGARRLMIRDWEWLSEFFKGFFKDSRVFWGASGGHGGYIEMSCTVKCEDFHVLLYAFIWFND